MLSAVLVFGKEKKEPAAGTEAAAQPTTPATTEATTTTPTATTTEATTSAAAPQGDPVAGKKVFADSSCGGCHTLKAAGSSGNVGPNLDDKKPSFSKIVSQVERGGGPMPAFKGQLSDKQIQDVAAFVYASTHS
jgi:mono/diheme cytochrome c family protein